MCTGLGELVCGGNRCGGDALSWEVAVMPDFFLGVTILSITNQSRWCLDDAPANEREGDSSGRRGPRLPALAFTFSVAQPLGGHWKRVCLSGTVNSCANLVIVVSVFASKDRISRLLWYIHTYIHALHESRSWPASIRGAGEGRRTSAWRWVSYDSRFILRTLGK